MPRPPQAVMCRRTVMRRTGSGWRGHYVYTIKLNGGTLLQDATRAECRRAMARHCKGTPVELREDWSQKRFVLGPHGWRET